MCFTFKKNNKQTKKPINRFLQDDVSAGILSLQTSIEIKFCLSMEWTLVNGLYAHIKVESFTSIRVSSPLDLINFPD